MNMTPTEGKQRDAIRAKILTKLMPALERIEALAISWTEQYVESGQPPHSEEGLIAYTRANQTAADEMQFEAALARARQIFREESIAAIG
jgi:hypothetical protein